MEFFTSSRHGYVLTPVQVWHTSVVQSSPIWGFSAFVAEPVSQMADLYHPVHWKHTYSFPIYVGLYLLASSIAKKGIDCGKSFQKDSNP